MSTTFDLPDANQEQWLKRYYYLRALFSIVWVTAAFAVGTKVPAIAALLLVVYPAWDATANWIDATRSGGLAKNRTQRINVGVSGVATAAVLVALNSGMGAVIAVVGAWAIASGLLQLSTAVRRWKSHGAQWTMILSGAQSALAGGFFIAQSRMETPPSIANVAGYAGVGALYFLISGVWLTVRHMRSIGPSIQNRN
ncbi:DUF308 domain-containing protein [Variovorax sp. Root434]|uniref:DUF308 domain-containing protein n=1 Tax=Variovorax sp. Root434 TaxID=1736536 RepID=UPI0006FE99C1|nr:DUF308 domain-containing protein [Variovorax sp. Root434]KQX21880.1 hypothetical protein ASD05_12965 [Variovorax sp. Root434]